MILILETGLVLLGAVVVIYGGYLAVVDKWPWQD